MVNPKPKTYTMNINGRISILTNGEYTSIQIKDEASAIVFVDIRLTPEQFCRAIGREMSVECAKTEIRGTDLLGKKMENKYYTFFVGDLKKGQTEELNRQATLSLKRDGMADWVPDKYYGSQGSFFSKEDKNHARVTIRRWVNPENTES